MTSITIRRAVTEEDAYGDPKEKSWGDWKTFAAPDYEVLIGWGNADEPLEPGRNTVITNRTVYIRGPEKTGIRATDRAVVDGVEYMIVGKVGEWEADEYVGAQFAIREVA